MVRLSLFRHAKSSWADPSVGDFQRPLNARGREAAPRMGRYMADAGLVPDLVLCSTAARAKETLDLVLPEISPRPDIRYEERLYLARPDILIAMVRKCPSGTRHLMIVGHNPGLHVLALELLADGPPDLVDDLAGKFPTAAHAIFEFDGAWRDIAPRTCRLHSYMVPRALAAPRAT